MTAKERDERMITFEEAIAVLDRLLAGRLVEAERVDVRQAEGRVLAEAPASRFDLPPFDKSAMDGYAIMEGDVRESYRVLECVAAGQCPTRPLEPGTAVKIMTGAPVPSGTGRVVMIEDTDGGDNVVCIRRVGSKTNICPKGEDVRVGDPVLPVGTKLDALAAANLMGCGVTEVGVRRPVRAAILSTGDELVESPQDAGPGKIIDTNGPLLASLCRRHGVEAVWRRAVPDVREKLASAMVDALSEADILIVTGGVSEGDYDYVPAAMRDAGLEINFDRVAIKPGKPLTFATGESGVAIGLPGNPVSVYLSFHLFVLRAARRLSGASPEIRPIRVALARDFRQKNADRSRFVPCRINGDGQAEAIQYHGSAHLLAMCEADGFFRVPLHATSLSAGQTIDFYAICD